MNKLISRIAAALLVAVVCLWQSSSGAQDLSCLHYDGPESLEVIGECARGAAFGGNPVAFAALREVLRSTGGDLFLSMIPATESNSDLDEDGRRWYVEIVGRANKGNLFHQVVAGRLLKAGIGGAPDVAKARTYWKNAADLGFGPAMFAMAEDLASEPENGPRAVDYFTQAGDAGLPAAWWELGRMFNEGRGVERDAAKANAYWTRGAEAGHALCAYEAGIQLTLWGSTPEEMDKAKEWLRAAAIQGHEDAGRYLVDVLGDVEFQQMIAEAAAEHAAVFGAPLDTENGFGAPAAEPPAPSCVRSVADSDIQALTECVRERAMWGNPVALAIYRQGLEIQGDLLEWDRTPRLFSSTFEGNPEHMQWLFDVLDRAKEGNLFYQTLLGRLHYKGAGVLEDREEAKKTWEKAANAGYGPAAFLLADWYKYWGRGSDTYARITQAYDQAIAWGMPLAAYWAGVFYRDGYGYVPKDPAKAIRYWTQSAEDGYVLCQYIVGMAHAEGLDGTVNENLARYWMKEAANQGFDLAQQYLVFTLGEPLPTRRSTGAEGGSDAKEAWAELVELTRQGEMGSMRSKSLLKTVSVGLPRMKISTEFGKVPIKKFRLGGNGARADGIVVRFDGVGYAGGKGGMENFERSPRWVNRQIRLLFAVPATTNPQVPLIPIEYQYGVRYSPGSVGQETTGVPWPQGYRASMWDLYPHDVASGVDYVLFFIDDSLEPRDVYVGLAAFPTAMDTQQIRANHPDLAANAVSSNIGEMAFGLTRPVDQSDVLIERAYKGDVGGVARLVAQGVDINSVPTVFHYVWGARNGFDVDVLSGLIDLGADPTRRGFREITALQVVAGVMRSRAPYNESVDLNSAKAIEFLVAAGCDVNAVGDSNQRTPLMAATSGNGAPHAIRTLLRLGADPYMVSGQGKTAEELIMPEVRELNLEPLRQGM